MTAETFGLRLSIVEFIRDNFPVYSWQDCCANPKLSSFVRQTHAREVFARKNLCIIIFAGLSRRAYKNFRGPRIARINFWLSFLQFSFRSPCPSSLSFSVFNAPPFQSGARFIISIPRDVCLSALVIHAYSDKFEDRDQEREAHSDTARVFRRSREATCRRRFQLEIIVAKTARSRQQQFPGFIRSSYHRVTEKPARDYHEAMK